MLKDALKAMLAEIRSRELRRRSLMENCIDTKLDRSLEHYKSNLEDTCRFILTKNPISVLKYMGSDDMAAKKGGAAEEDASDGI